MEQQSGSTPPPPKPELSGIRKWLENRGILKPTSQTASGDGGGQQPLPDPSLQPEKTRTYGGLLPEGSTVKPLNADTKTHVEYGEKTWTTAQTIRDVLQNHLDANTQQFFDHLVSSVIDIDRLSERRSISERSFDEFTYNLFRFRKGLDSFSPDAEKEMLDLLNNYASYVPLKPELLDVEGKINLHALKQIVAPVVEVRPRVTYKLVDLGTDGVPQVQWIDYDQLRQSQFLEPTGSPQTTGGFRYQVVGMKVEDQGSGFDAKLSAFYKSTKRGQRHLRGKFGEGAKMSETHLLRHGAFIKMRSRFEINGTQPMHERAWQHRGYLGEDNTVLQKGIQVDFPTGQEAKIGSFTLITIDKADPTFQQEFRANVDPRLPSGGLAQNCLEYSNNKFYYPMSRLGYSDKSVGVSLDVPSRLQYVQGLRVGTDDTSQQEIKPLFSYDFLDSSILQGRDRSEFNRGMASQIRDFWQNADSPVLLAALIKKIAAGKHATHDAPEAGLLDPILGGFDQVATGNNTQKGRTSLHALRVFPESVGAQAGTKNVIVNPEHTYQDRDLINALQARGYNIIELKTNLYPRSINNLNLVHEGTYQFHNIATAAAELESTRNEMDPNDERVHIAREVYHSALAEIGNLAEKAGFSITDFNVETAPQFHEVIDPAKDAPFGLNFDTKTQRFQFTIRPALLAEAVKAEGGREYWKRRIQVELLSTYKRTERFPDQNTLLIASQDMANTILINTLHSDQADVDALPLDFNYAPQFTDIDEAIKRFSSEEANPKEALVGWAAFRAISKFKTGLDEMAIIAEAFPQVPEPYKQWVKDMMDKRVIVEDGNIGYFDHSAGGEAPVFVKRRLDSLAPVGEVNGSPVYHLGDKLFLHSEMPDNSVIKVERAYDDHTFVMYGDELLDFSKYQFGPYRFNSYPFIFEKGGLVYRIAEYDRDNPLIVRQIEGNIKSVQITPPERKSQEGMRFLQGVVDTPFPSDYGVDEWNNPVRVFQDIVQNHLDASVSGKVEAAFEVQRGGGRVWVGESDINDSDIIVGLQVFDKGEGYTPNDLGTVGKSSKKSPLFAGKYGEGQKMIAAAAIRNGLELKFSSLANYEGERFRWEGVVGTRPEEIIIKGTPTNVDRVIFNVNSNPAPDSEDYTSSTIIRLPNGVNPDTHVWQQWLQVIDPRIKDQFGEGGLARYVLPMKKGNGEQIIDMGYMKILLDRPGQIYENGLLVSAEGNTAFGYDVPEVVTTRERNHYDYSRMMQYVANALYSCPDPRLATAFIQQFKEKYLEEVVTKGEEASIRERDLNFGALYSHHWGKFIPAKPYWRQAYDAQLGKYLVFSASALESTIKYRLMDLGRDYISEDRKVQAEYELEQARTALANIGHIPTDHIINVSGDQYANWATLFPTAEEYIMNLSEQEVPVTEDIHQTLENAVSGSTAVLAATQDELRSTSEGQEVFESISTKVTPANKNPQDVFVAVNKIGENLGLWTKDDLQKSPHRVFVAPANAGYLGAAVRDRVGFNEQLLVADNLKIIVGVSRHELIHKIYGLSDYTPEFIMLLLESAKANIRVSQN